MARTKAAYFTPGLFEFLQTLKVNNDRDWFAAHKAQYTALVEEPMIRFISDLGKRLRDGIVSEPAAWSRVLAKGIEIQGESLQRPPRGYDPEHRFTSDLKRKDFYTLRTFSDKEVCAPAFMETYLAACAKASPLVEFQCRALGLRWK
jgi:uncharacterized protein (DUF2461 family)